MSQTIPCPECANRIRVSDDLLGRRIRCPRCNHAFDAVSPEAASPVTADSAPEPAPRPVARPARPAPVDVVAADPPADRDHWDTVRTGVNLQILAHLLYVLGGVLIFGSFFLLLALDDSSSSSRSSGPAFFDRLMGVGVLVGTLLVFANWLASLAANGYSLAAPLARGSRSLAIVGAALVILVVVESHTNYRLLANLAISSRGNVYAPDMMAPSGPRAAVGQTSWVVAIQMAAVFSAASLAALVEFARLAAVPLFCRSVGQNLRDRSTAGAGLIAAVVSVVAFVAVLGFDLLLRLRNRASSSFNRDDETVVMFLLVVALGAAHLLIVLTGIFALLRARATISRHLSLAARAEVP